MPSVKINNEVIFLKMKAPTCFYNNVVFQRSSDEYDFTKFYKSKDPEKTIMLRRERTSNPKKQLEHELNIDDISFSIVKELYERKDIYNLGISYYIHEEERLTKLVNYLCNKNLLNNEKQLSICLFKCITEHDFSRKIYSDLKERVECCVPQVDSGTIWLVEKNHEINGAFMDILRKKRKETGKFSDDLDLATSLDDKINKQKVKEARKRVYFDIYDHIHGGIGDCDALFGLEEYTISDWRELSSSDEEF